MRGTRAKSIRRYVRGTFPMFPSKALYHQRPDGPIILAPQTQRSVYQGIKRNYKKKQRGELL